MNVLLTLVSAFALYHLVIFDLQILSAEEQLKRQNSSQGNPCRPPLPLHVDTATDSGSMTRINTPRMGSDGNPCGEADGGAADDGSNHNLQSRQLPRLSSTSPSADSQQRKSAANMVIVDYFYLMKSMCSD